MLGAEYGVILNQMDKQAIADVPQFRPAEYVPSFMKNLAINFEFELGLPEYLGGSIALRIDNRCGRLGEISRYWHLSRFGETDEVQSRTSAEIERRRIICGQKGPLAFYRVP